MKLPDEQLEILYRNAFPQVAKLIAEMKGDFESARDIFHDALIIFIEKYQSGNLQLTGSASAYLVGISKMLWYQQLRRQQYNRRMEESQFLLLKAIEAEPKNDETQFLLHELKQTGTRCLELLSAFYYEEKPLDQIAEEMQYKNVRSATVQKFKCIEKLRSRMKRKHAHATAA